MFILDLVIAMGPTDESYVGLFDTFDILGGGVASYLSNDVLSNILIV